MKNAYGNKMDIITTVIFIENALMAGRSGFSIITEFGRIGVENNTMFEDEVVVTKWIDAPPTKWAEKNCNRINDYYISIRVGKTNYMTHTKVIMAVTRCLLMNIFHEDEPSEAIIDASIKVYLMTVDGACPTINSVCKDWGLEYMSPIVRKEVSVKNLIRELIVRRDDAANNVIRRAEELVLSTHKYIGDNMYHRAMIGIIMYMADLIGRRDNICVNLNISNDIFNIIENEDVIMEW